MPSPVEMNALRDRLHAARYTVDAVSDRLGEASLAGLARNSTVPARQALGSDDDAQATLLRLWVLQDAVPRDSTTRALGDLEPLVAAGLIEVDGDDVRPAATIRPYAAEGTANTPAIEGWVCHDLLPNLDGRTDQPGPGHVLGISPASTTLAQMTVRRPVASALDLGTGCGVQVLHLATHAQRIVATDLNPRALDHARITLALSGLQADVRKGSLYEPVADERFDLITTNPPYVMSPPSKERLTYREGLLPRDELVRQVVVGGSQHLAPGGTMQVLGNWAVCAGEPWEDRLAGWIKASGCDGLVLERERLDVYSYIELWLEDAGLHHSLDYGKRYQEWLDYFAALGIEGVGMGWISLSNSGRTTPDIRVESWPFDVRQPVGDAFARHHDASRFAHAPDEQILNARWRRADDVVQETWGRPGAEDPEHIIIRQGSGFARAIDVDTALAALIGACDGELTSSEIMSALATLLEVDASTLAEDLLPRLRRLIADGFLLEDGDAPD